MTLRHLNITQIFSLLVALVVGCADDDTSVNTVDVDAGADISPDVDLQLACEGLISSQTLAAATHVPAPTPIPYEFQPPAGGSHRPYWAQWGEYSVLLPEVYVHNLEHGGVAFLYRPDASTTDIEALREFAKVQDAASGGTFRWILTPYDGLETPVAAVAWGWVYTANCVDAQGLDVFVERHYRQAPEDIGSDGAYRDGFLGRL